MTTTQNQTATISSTDITTFSWAAKKVVLIIYGIDQSVDEIYLNQLINQLDRLNRQKRKTPPQKELKSNHGSEMMIIDSPAKIQYRIS